MDAGCWTINAGGCLLSLDKPLVMGILNLTPDSFYADSRTADEGEVEERVRRMLQEGAAIVDVGACSTRPGFVPVAEEEERTRLDRGLRVLRRVAPEAVVSVDTFRASVARHCVEQYGVQIVNDVTGGAADEAMFRTVGELGVPYVLTYCEPPAGDLMTEALQFFGRKVQELHEAGVKDILPDPGFGFGKTLEQNYEMMRRLDDLQVLGLPLLVGVSRKSMIYRLLDSSPEEALGGTTVLNTVALMKGASILRVHDVKEAAEAVEIWEKLRIGGAAQ